MDQQTADKIIEATHWPRMAGAAALGMLAIFLLVGTFKVLKEYRYVGSGLSANNTITVSGEGEVFAVPDMATFSVTVQEEAKEVKAAQDVVTKKANDIKAYLEKEGVEEKDIRTADYSVYPQYDYLQAACREGYCPPGRQELRGYQVSITYQVKVRDTEKAGDLLSGIGALGATNVSGLSFTIDDEETLQAEARGIAIEEASAKAKELADQLGVKLVRIVNFSDNGYYPPMPYAYGRGGLAMDSSFAQETKMANAPELPVGENRIVSNVSITYEIR